MGFGGCGHSARVRPVSALAEADRDKLARLLGMLGSDHLGEVANAGRLADKLVRSAGLTWPDIIAPALSPPDTNELDADPIGADWRRTAAACSRYPLLLNKWEAEFIASLLRFPRLSAKQRECLMKIVVRLRACGCEL
jgi:hypothetical protein